MRQSETEEGFQRPRKKKSEPSEEGELPNGRRAPRQGGSMSFMFCDLRMAVVVSMGDEYADERAAVFARGDGKRPADSG